MDLNDKKRGDTKLDGVAEWLGAALRSANTALQFQYPRAGVESLWQF